MNEKIKNTNIITAAIGLLAGIALIAIGIFIYTTTYYGYRLAYSIKSNDIQNAIRQIHYGAWDLHFVLRVSFGTIMLLGGVLTMMYNIRGIVYSKNVDDVTPPRARNYDDVSTELEKFYDLYSKGILTEEEFTIQKQRILGYKEIVDKSIIKS